MEPQGQKKAILDNCQSSRVKETWAIAGFEKQNVVVKKGLPMRMTVLATLSPSMSVEGMFEPEQPSLQIVFSLEQICLDGWGRTRRPAGRRVVRSLGTSDKVAKIKPRQRIGQQTRSL